LHGLFQVDVALLVIVQSLVTLIETPNGSFLPTLGKQMFQLPGDAVMGEPEICLESDSIWIPVDLVRSSTEHNVFQVIVHIQDIITVACHQIGTVVVALHHVDPHPLFLVAMELKPPYYSARDGRGSTPDDLCVPGKGRLEHVHQESHVLGVILQPTFSVAVDVPQSTVDEDDVWISAPALFGVEVDQLCQVVRVATSDEEVGDLNVSFWAAKVPLLSVEGFRGCPVVHPTPELVSVVFVEQLVPLVRVSFPLVLIGVPDLSIVTDWGQMVVVLGVQQIHEVFVHASHDRVANHQDGAAFPYFTPFIRRSLGKEFFNVFAFEYVCHDEKAIRSPPQAIDRAMLDSNSPHLVCDQPDLEKSVQIPLVTVGLDP